MPGGNAAEALRTALHHKHGQAEGRTRAALRRVGFSAQELDTFSVRWCSGFPRIAGPLVLSTGCWVHDGFQMLCGLSDAPTLPARCRCLAATEHRTNNAHLVLLPSGMMNWAQKR